MDTKLTLKLDSQVIERAKSYARKKNTSLSKLIEAYLQFLTSGSKPDLEGITPLVKSLSGVLDATKLSNNDDAYKKHLTKKYSR
jgi:hypothetical protein